MEREDLVLLRVATIKLGVLDGNALKIMMMIPAQSMLKMIHAKQNNRSIYLFFRKIYILCFMNVRLI